MRWRPKWNRPRPSYVIGWSGLRSGSRFILEAEKDGGSAVDAAFAALEAEKQAHARTHEDRNQVLARERKKDRMLAGIRRDLHSGKSEADVLATYWNEARRAA